MAEARNGADSNTPAVEMEAVSMNCRRVEWNKMASFRKPAASWLLLRLGSAAGCGNCWPVRQRPAQCLRVPYQSGVDLPRSVTN